MGNKCHHLMHLPSGKCLGCSEQHQPLSDYQPGDDEAFIREHLSEEPSPIASDREALPASDYDLLKAYGHSPAKAAEIILDAKRGDLFNLRYLAFIRQTVK